MHRIMGLLLILLTAAGCANSNTSDPPPATPAASSETAKPDTSADDRPIILAFGDSLTAGSGLPPGSGYPEMLQAELDRRGYKYHVVNAGIGGDTTGGGLARVESAIAMHPEVVILELGGNDGLRGIPIDSMQSNLDELIVKFQAAGAKVILAGMTLPRNMGPEYIGAFEKVYTTLAARHKVTLIPFLLEGAAGHGDRMLEDGIHPNQAGYRFVTENVLQSLEPLLKK
jgi:acyl-CoA thioesterase I